ncbi:acyclic terpene utilization AtuA family protein [Bordetella genomosp. 13]|uniref:Terpene utilization protein AtuA n=1 Tax=Bordetella genomosp. 13 TaxID=463040 RepID=A0A1W6Z8X1_9BORD|nr:acyclic terpene utilization AtuA family protein [Bordetella genomosp. 13]ARP93685.1 terpene utilization protein AtuA [Bordetella genomosp. 13]
MSGKSVVRIGCGAGFWGDTPEGARQLVAYGDIDYLILDYLAEVTMSILAKMKARDPAAGYATDFVTQVIAAHGRALAERRIKVVVNAGGVNPLACRQAVEHELARQGVALKVAAVQGDDVLPQTAGWRQQGVREMYSGAELPQTLVSANAYLGAFPIAAALDDGADIVITGRCVDSALALGPLIHEFGWTRSQADLLSAGSLAGHVLECGPQCTGGFATDWQATQAGWADIGFPVAICHADGSFVVTKPPGTGGAVTCESVAEQITYETGDPRCYRLPDVCCDWSQVRVSAAGADQVLVSGARGGPAPRSYKVSATYADGYRCLATVLVRGRDAVDKAHAVARAILGRSTAVLARQGMAPFSETSVEVLGAEDGYGPHARTAHTREVVLKVAARHDVAAALEVFAREIFPTSTSTVQGVAGVFGGRPKVQPVVRLFSFLVPQETVQVSLVVGDEVRPLGPPLRGDAAAACKPDDTPAGVMNSGAPHEAGVDATESQADMRAVPLAALAHARSGDKGDISNIAVLARRPEFVELIRRQLTARHVRDYMAHLVEGDVQRHDWPGLDGFNYLLHRALGGGGVASLRYDPQGKAHAEILLDCPVRIPAQWIEQGWVPKEEVLG